MILFEDQVPPATSTAATTSYPYYSEGPVGFQNENFIHTCQTDYYYDASSSLLVSQVEQCRSELGSYWTIFGSVCIFVVLVLYGTYFIAKRYR